jgi:hypothetical protein
VKQYERFLVTTSQLDTVARHSCTGHGIDGEAA